MMTMSGGPFDLRFGADLFFLFAAELLVRFPFGAKRTFRFIVN
jgi:hypothetical protein